MNATHQRSSIVLHTGEVEAEILKYLERCLQAGSLTLEMLYRIEDKVINEISVESFSELGHGSFLQLLTTEHRIKAVSDLGKIYMARCCHVSRA